MSARPADATANVANHPAPAREMARQWRLWFGLFGGPAAWTVQTLVNLPVAAHGCYPNLYPLGTPVVSIRAIGIAVSLVAAAVSIAALVIARRTWRRTRSEHHEASGKASAHDRHVALLETGEGRTRFMALCGVMLSAMFTVAALIHAASLLLVAPCA